jgi:hypothetical protein
VSGYNISTLQTSSLQTSLLKYEKCIMRQDVFSIQRIHLWTLGNPYANHECGLESHFCLNVWAGIIGDIVLGPPLVGDSLTAQLYCNYVKTIPL